MSDSCHPYDCHNVPPAGVQLDDEVLAGTRHFHRETSRVFLACSRLIGLGLAHVLSRWWTRHDPVQAAAAERTAAQVEAAKHCAIEELLRQRLSRFPARQRKHYTPRERFEILALAARYGMSREETADAFLVDTHTIARWEREALAEPDSDTIGTLVRPDPPLTSYDDVIKRLVQWLDDLEIGGSGTIAGMVARAGVKISRETVRRHRKAPRLTPTNDDPPRSLRAKYPNHIWMADLTEIRSFLGLIRLKLAAVIDVFSRLPLAYAVFLSEPSAEQMLALLDQAMRLHGRPRHFVSDQGPQFTAGIFRATLDALSIRQRFGAIGQYGSIAIMERFWRTLKQLLDVKLFPPISKAHVEARVELALAYYAVFRPHQGLDGATPAEVYLNLEPAAHRAVRPPRACERDPTADDDFPFDVVYLDPERRLPILIRTDQAA